MQDRFKLRCFNKIYKRMFDVIGIYYHNGILKRIDVANEGKILIFDEWENHIDNTILLQCTGLKDKNGTLIYEADIVKSDFEFVTIALNPLRFDRGTVIYSDYTSGFMVASDISDFSPYKNARFGKKKALNCIVIGNIYTNPELIGGEEC